MRQELENRLNIEITREEHMELLDRMVRKFGDDKFDKFRNNATFHAVIECLVRGGNAIELINQLITIIDNQSNEMSKHYETCPGWFNQFLRENNRNACGGAK